MAKQTITTIADPRAHWLAQAERYEREAIKKSLCKVAGPYWMRKAAEARSHAQAYCPPASSEAQTA